MAAWLKGTPKFLTTKEQETAKKLPDNEGNHERRKTRKQKRKEKTISPTRGRCQAGFAISFRFSILLFVFVYFVRFVVLPSVRFAVGTVIHAPADSWWPWPAMRECHRAKSSQPLVRCGTPFGVQRIALRDQGWRPPEGGLTPGSLGTTPSA
jgi:hypothetical protein